VHIIHAYSKSMFFNCNAKNRQIRFKLPLPLKHFIKADYGMHSLAWKRR